MLLDDVAVAVQLPLYHVGGVEVPAVDAGGLGGDDLEGGDVVVLAEGVAGQIQGGEVLAAGEDAPHVTLEVHAGLLHQPEGLHIVVEPVGAHAQADADEGGVAGVPHCLLEDLVAVAVFVGAADGLPADGDGAAALEGAVGGYGALLQGHGQCEDLGGGAGLIGVVDRLVAPLPVLQQPQGLPVGVRVLLAGGGGVLLLHLGQLRLEQGVVDAVVVVDVVGGAGGDGQDAPGVGVHDNARRAVFRPVLGHHVLQPPLHVGLDDAVQGQLEAVAVLGVVVLLILEHDLGAAPVLGGDRQAGAALQLLVVEGLQAVGSPVVGVQKADDVGGQGAVGIVALGVGLQVHPLEHRAGVVAGDKLPDLVADALLHPPLDNGVHVVGPGHLVADLLLVDLQDLRQPLGDHVLVGLAAHGQALPLGQARVQLLQPGQIQLVGPPLDGVGVQEDVVRRGGHGQNGAAAVVDAAPGGGDDGAAHLLAGGP